MIEQELSAAQAVDHLRPEVWAEVSGALIAKAIGEFARELLIEPVRTGDDGPWGLYTLAADAEQVEYRFRARILRLEHWCVDAASIRKQVSGVEVPVDALEFVADMRGRLGIPARVLPGYLEEIASTLAAAAYKHVHQRRSSRELVHAEFQQIEAAMTEGHPVFVANNGRIGFDPADYRAYAPETGAIVRLVWLAAHERFVLQACVQDLAYEELLESELGPQLLGRLRQQLRDRGLEPGAYRFLPVHPWQWENRIAQQFATDLAGGDLVYLGVGEDEYQAQQSIRTFFNRSHPTRRYVKTALSIVNLGFWRGLDTAIGSRVTAMNDWVGQVVSADPYLRNLGFEVLREVAFIGYRHRHFERAVERRGHDHQKRLAALWRESPVGKLRAGERLMTMSALLHRDRDGVSLLAELIAASGLAARSWVERYLRAYLQPLLHCFYAHDLVFTPHCENVILVLREHVPVRVLMKDIGQDAGILNPEWEVPATVRHQVLRIPEQILTLSIFTDAFDGVLRFMAALLHEHGGVREEQFWRLVADCIAEYQASQPEQAGKHARLNLFAPTFIRNCLNRLQLLHTEEMVNVSSFDAEVGSLQFAGTLDNPVTPFGRAVSLSDATGR